jgi:hypothetical protein
MTDVLREMLAERAHAIDAPRMDASALVARGEKRLRHRRLGAVAGSVLAVALAVGGPALVMDLRHEPRSVNQPKPLPPPKKGDDGIKPPARPLVYVEGSVLHVGSRQIDTGMTPALVGVQAEAMTGHHVPDSQIMNSLQMTDDGAVFTTLDGRLWFSDGETIVRLWGVPGDDRVGGVVGDVQTESAGSRVAWLAQLNSVQRELVVYDTAEGALLSRVELPGHPVRIVDMYGDDFYWETTTGRSGNGPGLMRTVLSTSTHESATQGMLAAERQSQTARTLVVGQGEDAQLVSTDGGGDPVTTADPDDPSFRLSRSRLEAGLFDQEFQDVVMPIIDPVSGKELRFRAPAHLQIDKLALFEWFDDDRFVLSTRPALHSAERRDFVMCRKSTEQCEVILRMKPGPWLALPGVGMPG